MIFTAYTNKYIGKLTLFLANYVLSSKLQMFFFGGGGSNSNLQDGFQIKGTVGQDDFQNELFTTILFAKNLNNVLMSVVALHHMSSLNLNDCYKNLFESLRLYCKGSKRLQFFSPLILFLPF